LRTHPKLTTRHTASLPASLAQIPSRLTANSVAIYKGYASLDVGFHLQPARHSLVVLPSFATCSDVRLDLQPTRHCLVVLQAITTSFNVGLDLQSASDGLVVLDSIPTSLHVRFDFHTSSPVQNCCSSTHDRNRAISSNVSCVASHQVRRERKAGLIIRK